MQKDNSADTYESHRSLIDPAMKQRLDQLIRTTNQYKTKACGMHSMIGLVGLSNAEIAEQRD